MRGMACLFLCVCFLFCSGCAQTAADPVTTGFRCRVRAAYDDVEIQAILDCCDAAQTVVDFESPKSLEGLRLAFINDTIKMEFLGMSFDIPDEYRTEAMLLADTIKSLNNDALQQGGRDSRFVFDNANGLPLLFTPDDGVTVFFSDWELQQAENVA